MTETTVITNEEPPEDPSVLAQAAVAAAALAGASAAKADDAQGDAESAEATSELALHQAGAAVSIASDKVDEERARQIAREELAAALFEALSQKTTPPPEKSEGGGSPTTPPPENSEINPQVLPPSVEKANPTRNGRTKWARAWEEG